MEDNEFMLKLDQIMDSFLNKGASGGEDLEFVRRCEKKIFKELLEYTNRISPPDQGCQSSEEEELEIVICGATHVIDAICQANKEYMKVGMKIGAGLIFQLLGK